MYLKAGEYGDNAVDYGEAEESGMGGGPVAPGGPTTTTASTAGSVTTPRGTFTPVMRTLKSSVASSSMHSFLSYTEEIPVETTTSIVSTKKPSSVAETHVRLSKLDAQKAPTTNASLGQRSLGVAAPRPRTFMTFVVFFMYCFFNEFGV